MRWEELFADLERQWEALAESERQAEISERSRAEFARVTLLDRLRGSEGRSVRLRTHGGAEAAGELARVGADFVLVAAPRHECVLPVAAVVAASGLAATSLPGQATGPVLARLGLGSVLRRVAADRSVVSVLTTDGRSVSGTVQRVGADFLELTEHAVDDRVHGIRARERTLVPFAAVAVLRREAPEARG